MEKRQCYGDYKHFLRRLPLEKRKSIIDIKLAYMCVSIGKFFSYLISYYKRIIDTFKALRFEGNKVLHAV